MNDLLVTGTSSFGNIDKMVLDLGFCSGDNELVFAIQQFRHTLVALVWWGKGLDMGNMEGDDNLDKGVLLLLVWGIIIWWGVL